MKKTFFSLAVFFFVISHSFAQFNSGSMFISGSTALSVDLSGRKWESANSQSDNAHKHAEIAFNPMAGYFFKNRMAIGGMIDYTFSMEGNDNSKTKEASFLVGPVARYYFNYSVSGVMPFAEIDAALGMLSTTYDYGEDENEEKYSLFRLSGGAGINYFLNDHIAFETRLKYYFLNQKSKEEGNDFKYIHNGVLFRFGLTFFFSSI